jgi:hypothetical protein
MGVPRRSYILVGMSNKMQDGLTSDSQAYPPDYWWTLRNIDEAKDHEFAYRPSQILAWATKDEVRLMVPWKSDSNPKASFHTDEWTILKRKSCNWKAKEDNPSQSR